MTNVDRSEESGTARAAIANAMVLSLQTSSETKLGASSDEGAASLKSVMGELEALLGSSPELQRAVDGVAARNVRQTLAFTSSAAVPSTGDFVGMLRTQTVGPKSKAGTFVRTYWWGFQLYISHEDLETIFNTGMTVNGIATLVGGSIPGPQQPFFPLIGSFIAATLGALKALDRGRGIYISMSWWLAGIFVPQSA